MNGKLDIDRYYRGKIKKIRGIRSRILNLVARKCFSEKAIYTPVETDRNLVMYSYGRKLFCGRNKFKRFEDRLFIACEWPV